MENKKISMGSLLPKLVFKRIRPAIGCAGYVLITAAFAGLFNLQVILFMLSFALIYVAADLYNDYSDYHEDLRNERTDKLTVSGIVSPENMKRMSFVVCAVSLLLSSWNPALLLFTIFSGLVFYSYSDHRIRLKKYTVKGYVVFALVFPLLPFAIPYAFSVAPLPLVTALALALYLFSQIMYILCQKDSTDKKDDINLFIKHGHSKSVNYCALFAFLSAAPLVFLSLNALPLLAVAGANAALKAANVLHISTGATREFRSRIMLFEHLTPVIYTGVLLWL